MGKRLAFASEMERESDFSIVVVMPTFNNARTLRDVVRRTRKLGLGVIVVNDGSTDETESVIAQLQGDSDFEITGHASNRGKAAALMTGFRSAEALGYTHAVTIDTDGQLDPGQIPLMIEAARQEPRALVLGVRDESAPGYLPRSRWGRRISNWFIFKESGLRVRDSQCGFRVYPLEFIRRVPCSAGRYGFETEILTRAGWSGVAVREVPVTCVYPSREHRISHFRPWMDTWRAVGMHARLVGARLMTWFSPKRAWRELREQPGAASEMAKGLAVGVFIGNLPVFGMHSALSVLAARWLGLHPLSVVAGSHISTPPIGPVLVLLAIGVGHLILRGSWVDPSAGWGPLAGRVALDWVVGSLVVGLLLAGVAYAASLAVLRRLSPSDQLVKSGGR